MGAVREMGESPLKYQYGGRVQRIGIFDSSAPPTRSTYFTTEPFETAKSRYRQQSWENENSTLKRRPKKEYQEGSGTAEQGLVAFLDYIEYSDRIFIAFVSVRQDYQGRGFATELVDWVYRRARSTGRKTVDWGKVLIDAFPLFKNYSERVVDVETVGKPERGYYSSINTESPLDRRTASVPRYMRAFDMDRKQTYRAYEPIVAVKVSQSNGSFPQSEVLATKDVPWESDLQSIIQQVTRDAQRAWEKRPSNLPRFSDPVFQLVSGGTGDLQHGVIATTKNLPNWGQPVAVGRYSETLFHKLYSILFGYSDRKLIWSTWMSDVVNISPEGERTHWSVSDKDTKITVYRGVSLPPNADPTLSEKYGGGAGNAWTTELSIAKAIAERGMAGFNLSNSPNQVYKVKPGVWLDGISKKVDYVIPTVLRAEVNLGDNASLYEGMGGYRYLSAEQEVNINPGTEFTLTGWMQADEVPSNPSERKRIWDEYKTNGNTYDNYDVTYRWNSRWNEVRLRRRASSPKIYRGVQVNIGLVELIDAYDSASSLSSLVSDRLMLGYRDTKKSGVSWTTSLDTAKRFAWDSHSSGDSPTQVWTYSGQSYVGMGDGTKRPPYFALPVVMVASAPVGKSNTELAWGDATSRDKNWFSSTESEIRLEQGTPISLDHSLLYLPSKDRLVKYLNEYLKNKGFYPIESYPGSSPVKINTPLRLSASRSEASSWRGLVARDYWNEAPAVLLVDKSARKNTYEVYVNGKQVSREWKLDDAKSRAEKEIGRNLSWSRARTEDVKAFHYYFGWTSEFTDPQIVYFGV